MRSNNGLTYAKIDALRPPQKGEERYDEPDPVTPNLYVRVGRRKKNFVLAARFGGAKHSTREILGEFPKMTIETARAKAEKWNRQLRQGIDPIQEEIRVAREEDLRARRTFLSVMEDFIADLPNRERNRHVGNDIKLIRHHLLDPTTNGFLGLPISEVTDVHLSDILEAIRDRPAQTQAVKAFSLVRTFWEWALTPRRRQAYGLQGNPFANVTLKQLKLKRRTRKRTLDVDELRAYWRATLAMPYPMGPYFRFVLMTGGRRKSEAAGARWRDMDFETRVWTIVDSKTGMAIIVPLTKEVIALLEEIRSSQPPNHGEFIFSNRNGQKPINCFSRAMNALRTLFAAELRKIDPQAEVTGFILHDTRRVVRTALAALGVPKEVAERVIGHGPEGIEAVYNQWEYIPQTMSALALFNRRLLDVVENRAADFVAGRFEDDQ
ncbi:integrase family protein [Rhizobium laguerreae]|uniref:tyrosine-type recombinase/integrase n=1 Tax=Rhizobium laguerreae TaxID=1076926 RepID=UPI001C91F4AB|nr:integrase family protein [Rhizobium laguerreae]MBY3181325.1 integrase family protein [Rhizobium laguerreae]